MSKIFVYDLEYPSIKFHHAKFVAKSKIEADKIVRKATIDYESATKIDYVGEIRKDGTIKGEK